MITEGNRRSGYPILVQGSLTTNPKRIPMNKKAFNESWIQDLIHENPNVLPVFELEDNFDPLIPIGKEVQTKSGNLDHLFISPDGYLTIVETKLWRNPEARREVVGQILDYAKEISKWSFSDLDRTVKQFNSKYSNTNDGIIKTIEKNSDSDESEQYLIDRITRNLERGRFLLLIVGDGIREGVEEMVSYLTQTPQLYFTLALVELQVYELRTNSDEWIVIPQIVTRTKEITRAIVRFEGKKPTESNVTIETVDEPTIKSAKGSKRFTITASDFFEQLKDNVGKDLTEFAEQILKDCEDRGYLIDWAQGSYVAKYPDPAGSGIKITLFVVEKRGGIYLGWSSGQLERAGMSKQLGLDYADKTAKLFKGLKPHPKNPHSWERNQELKALKNVYPNFLNEVEQFVKNIEEQSVNGM
jgi:hypothetical protein